MSILSFSSHKVVAESYTYIHFNLEFRVAKDKLVSSSYKYDPKYYWNVKL